jgi:hypothetical protein
MCPSDGRILSVFQTQSTFVSNTNPTPVITCWAPGKGRGFDSKDHPSPYVSLVFPYALQHAVLFESIVALSRATSQLQLGTFSQHDRAFVYHHGNAKSALQTRINSSATCSDDLTVLTIACLSTIDVGDQDPSSFGDLYLLRSSVYIGQP